MDTASSLMCPIDNVSYSSYCLRNATIEDAGQNDDYDAYPKANTGPDSSYGFDFAVLMSLPLLCVLLEVLKLLTTIVIIVTWLFCRYVKLKVMKLTTEKVELETKKLKQKNWINLPVRLDEDPTWIISVDLAAYPSITDLISHIKSMFDLKNECNAYIAHPEYQFLYAGSPLVLKNLKHLKVMVNRKKLPPTNLQTETQ